MKNEKAKIDSEEYLSFVRHELRAHLTVINEGISMVLEGLGGKDCKKCFNLLNISMKHVGETNKLIKELLTPSAFEKKGRK